MYKNRAVVLPDSAPDPGSGIVIGVRDCQPGVMDKGFLVASSQRFYSGGGLWPMGVGRKP